MILYWLALATWFGGVLFIALAAPIIFRTVREANPIMTSVLSVNLEGQHGTLLAGTIVANLLQRLMWLEMVCAGTLLLTWLGPHSSLHTVAWDLALAGVGVGVFLSPTTAP